MAKQLSYLNWDDAKRIIVFFVQRHAIYGFLKWIPINKGTPRFYRYAIFVAHIMAMFYCLSFFFSVRCNVPSLARTNEKIKIKMKKENKK